MRLVDSAKKMVCWPRSPVGPRHSEKFITNTPESSKSLRFHTAPDPIHCASGASLITIPASFQRMPSRGVQSAMP